MNERGLYRFVRLAGLAVAAAPSLAFADSVVIGSSNVKYYAGMVLEDNEDIELEIGGWLRLMDQSTGRTSTLNGKYAGKLVDYPKECSIAKRVLGSCREVPLRDPLGGTRRPQ
jgi:hypothetical protein